mmetsp:Transcript_136899/g.309269  ORF Transcript_136899/g.309269 Transcript_136899/m.309269 type:complete len:207 (-) Transcript_136899:285-905(-)
MRKPRSAMFMNARGQHQARSRRYVLDSITTSAAVGNSEQPTDAPDTKGASTPCAAAGIKATTVTRPAAIAPVPRPPITPTPRIARTAGTEPWPIAKLIFTMTASSKNWNTSITGVKKESAASNAFLSATESLDCVMLASRMETYTSRAITNPITISTAHRALPGCSAGSAAPASPCSAGRHRWRIRISTEGTTSTTTKAMVFTVVA